jgi:hypothetical protein
VRRIWKRHSTSTCNKIKSAVQKDCGLLFYGVDVSTIGTTVGGGSGVSVGGTDVGGPGVYVGISGGCVGVSGVGTGVSVSVGLGVFVSGTLVGVSVGGM